MSWLIFLIACLVTFRLALMLTEEEGPAGVFSLARRQFPKKTNPGRGVRCLKCVSIYTGALVTLALWLLGHVESSFAPGYAVALSSGAIIINRITDK